MAYKFTYASKHINTRINPKTNLSFLLQKMELENNLTELREQAAYLAANLQAQIASPNNPSELPTRPPSTFVPRASATPQPFPYSPFSTAVRLEDLDGVNPVLRTQPRTQARTLD